MFDLDWSKLALIAVVALVVIGPKDLPRVMRIVGQWVQRARAIAREFQGSIDQMVRESELEEMKRNFDKAASFDVEREIQNTIDPGGHLQRTLSEPALTNPLAETPPAAAAADALATAKPAEPAPPETAAATPGTPEPEAHRG